MPKTKLQKINTVKDLSEKLPKAKIIVFTSFSKFGEKGLSVQKTQELKRNLRSTESEYIVSKKTLMGVAFKNTEYSDMVSMENFDGSVGLVLGYGDIISASKSVYNFSKSNTSLKILGALMDKTFIGTDKFIELARLPSREVLLSKMMGVLSSPMSGLVNVLQGNLRNLVLILSNIKK